MSLAPYRFENPVLMKDEHGQYVFTPYWQKELQKRDVVLSATMAESSPFSRLFGVSSEEESASPYAIPSPVAIAEEPLPRLPVPPAGAEDALLPFLLQSMLNVQVSGFLYGTAASFTAAVYPAAAFDKFVFLETDTFKIRYSNGTAWTQILAPTLLPFMGLTSSFPALKRSGAILQARLADDSAYTDLEVLDEAYDATNWDSSLEVPTKNAIRDYIQRAYTAWTPTLASSAGDAATSFASSSIVLARYRTIGKQVHVTVRITGTLNAVTPSNITATLPGGISHQNAETYNPAGILNGAAYETGVVRCVGDTLAFYRANFANWGSGNNFEVFASYLFEDA